MPISDKVKRKLEDLPRKPGVYLMRDKNGKVIYIGKAKSLRNRVRNYFQQSTLRSADPKIKSLINSIEDLDFLVVKTDAEAILTEGRMIKEYRPRYNSSFKDDKRFLRLAIDVQSPYPRIHLVRIKKKDNRVYFGPYSSSTSARVAKDFLERRFGIRQCRPRIPDETNYKHCLDDLIRHCSAPCVARVSREEYRSRIDEAVAFLKGERPELLKELQEEMEQASEALEFEQAAAIRDSLRFLRKVVKERAKGLKTFSMLQDDAEKGLEMIREELRMKKVPQVIETFDISNISGTSAVASMVSAVDGYPNKNRYRQFRIKTIEGADDPRMMAEAVGRRYKRLRDEKKPMPDLIVVDGGITQLRASRAALDALGLSNQRIVGIAKRYEEIIWDVDNIFPPVRFPVDSPAMHILQRIRDEAHRFALTYHRKLRAKRIGESELDEIQGVGEKRKIALLKHFGSVPRLKKASLEDIQAVPGFAEKSAKELFVALHPEAEVDG